MKTGFYTAIPVGMLFKKHYCHKCGSKLGRESYQRMIAPDDPERQGYSRKGQLQIGDLTVTEFRFQCPTCSNKTEYSDQLMIEKIQKKLNRKKLTESDRNDHQNWAEAQMQKSKKKAKILEPLVIGIIFLAVAMLALWFMK